MTVKPQGLIESTFDCVEILAYMMILFPKTTDGADDYITGLHWEWQYVSSENIYRSIYLSIVDNWQ